MAILIDSALIDEVSEALASGFVTGVTTNPSLMAKNESNPAEVIREICRISDGPVFYQVTAKDPAERESEGRRVAAISPGQVVLKIPCTYSDLKLTAKLSRDIPCCVTAIFSGAQTMLAVAAGARYVVPYVNRATRALGNGLELVSTMAEVVARSEKSAEVLAASLKTPEEVVAATLAGAQHVTIPLELIKAMAEHEQSLAAIQQFEEDWDNRKGQ
jgi:transaldolase